jgi:hypothetical protein
MKKLKTFLASLVASAIVLMAYVVAPVAVTAFVPSTAQASECSYYETIHPNFPLTGSHMSTGKCSTCASCHSGGVFLGTPKVCATCHSGTWNGSTIGHTTAHIPHGAVNCDSCHNTTSFTATWAMNHANVSGQACTTCHTGNYVSYGAMGKDGVHIVTALECNACHAPVDMPTHTNADWFIPIDQIHAGITTGCVACHDGIHAKGKINAPAPGHPTNTSDQCEQCHSINNSFKCASALDDMIKKIKAWFV